MKNNKLRMVIVTILLTTFVTPNVQPLADEWKVGLGTAGTVLGLSAFVYFYKAKQNIIKSLKRKDLTDEEEECLKATISSHNAWMVGGALVGLASSGLAAWGCYGLYQSNGVDYSVIKRIEQKLDLKVTEKNDIVTVETKDGNSQEIPLAQVSKITPVLKVLAKTIGTGIVDTFSPELGAIAKKAGDDQQLTKTDKIVIATFIAGGFDKLITNIPQQFLRNFNFGNMNFGGENNED
jgi:hypothetical protein